MDLDSAKNCRKHYDNKLKEQEKNIADHRKRVVAMQKEIEVCALSFLALILCRSESSIFIAVELSAANLNSSHDFVFISVLSIC